jgi:hypothetical protein
MTPSGIEPATYITKVSSLMTRTEMVLKTLVYSPFNQLTRLLAREYFTDVKKGYIISRAYSFY